MTGRVEMDLRVDRLTGVMMVWGVSRPLALALSLEIWKGVLTFEDVVMDVWEESWSVITM